MCVSLHVRFYTIECKVKLFKYIQIFSENTNFSSRALLATVQCLPNALAIFPRSELTGIYNDMSSIWVLHIFAKRIFFFGEYIEHAFGKCLAWLDTMSEVQFYFFGLVSGNILFI